MSTQNLIEQLGYDLAKRIVDRAPDETASHFIDYGDDGRFDYLRRSGHWQFFHNNKWCKVIGIIANEIHNENCSPPVILNDLRKQLAEYEAGLAPDVRTIFKVGNKVEPINYEHTLASGCERYPHAYVVNVSPFQLISERGDMFWSVSAKPEGFRIISESIVMPKAVTDRMIIEGLLNPSIIEVLEKSTPAPIDQRIHALNKILERAPDPTADFYVADTDTYFSLETGTYFNHAHQKWLESKYRTEKELRENYESVFNLLDVVEQVVALEPTGIF